MSERTKYSDRSDHIWFRKDGKWKCALCGAITRSKPSRPTPPNWMPERYDELTPEDRSHAPFEAT